jgi:pimeloyl-ACP methyl ester carboxylesterase
MLPRLRHILKTVVIIVVVLLLAGATYQGVATALERRKYPHPGMLIDVGGHQLHIYCSGEHRPNVPTVILEAPEGGMSAEWGWVQSALSRTRRVCSYDRAGLGWSEAGDRPYDPGRVPEELHQLLRNAEIAAPYTVIGQSLGAAFARLYAARYPNDVAMLVLVDFPAADGPGDTQITAVSPWLARAGVLRASGMLADRAEGLPAHEAGVLRAFLNRPDHLTRASHEFARWTQGVTLAREARLRNDVKVRELTLRPVGPNDPLYPKLLGKALPPVMTMKVAPHTRDD